ncbi:hypothetical protein KY5_4984 [Streptomyces formicae]|uniref:Uncharacterized protein n=1 Tax=Streptomyces formicae TaxID=1616117 RepID=A0A291QEH0_9ACTN|nr:hypothetical protein KY5_4984 [Streptomyces formicae]
MHASLYPLGRVGADRGHRQPPAPSAGRNTPGFRNSSRGTASTAARQRGLERTPASVRRTARARREVLQTSRPTTSTRRSAALSTTAWMWKEELGSNWDDHGLVFARDGYRLCKGGTAPGGPQDAGQVSARWCSTRERLGLPGGRHCPAHRPRGHGVSLKMRWPRCGPCRCPALRVLADRSTGHLRDDRGRHPPQERPRPARGTNRVRSVLPSAPRVRFLSHRALSLGSCTLYKHGRGPGEAVACCFAPGPGADLRVAGLRECWGTTRS